MKRSSQPKTFAFSPFALARARRAAEPAERQLKDLSGIGPAMLEDFQQLGIRSVPQLAKADPGKLYRRLCKIRGQRMDPCVLDVFCCAVAQAKDPNLPTDQCQWWYWSRIRKAAQGMDGS